MTPVVDGGLLSMAPGRRRGRRLGRRRVPLLIGTTRDESAFFALGSPQAHEPDHGRPAPLDAPGHPRPRGGRPGSSPPCGPPGEARGESVEPRDLWSAIATEVVFRVGTVRLADAHAAAADPGVGTYTYLFTWESPAFDGVLGSCHALEIPFVFGTLKNPVVQAFSGGGEDAFALSALMRRAWTSFARTGVPACDLPGPDRGRGRGGIRDAVRRPCSAPGRVHVGTGPPGRRPAGAGARWRSTVWSVRHRATGD